MSKRAALLLSLVVFTASCQPPAPPPAPTPPKPVGGRAGSGITVEGEGLTADEKQAIGVAMEGFLTDVIGKAIQQGIEELFQKLKVTDDVERQLVGGVYDWGTPDEDGDTWSIFLIRPGDPTRPPETIEVVRDGRTLLRFTRAFAAVERPVATMTRARASQGRVTQVELFLTYTPKGKWETTRPTVKQENLRPGDR